MIGGLYLGLYAVGPAATQRIAWTRPAVGIYIDGVDQTHHVRLAGVTITDELNDQPNNASFRVQTITPHVGQDVRIYVGARHLTYQEFGGHILSVQQVYEGLPRHVAWDVQCIDYTWLLNRRKALWRYTNQSATAILRSLITSYTQDIGYAHVAADLPVIDEITFTNEDITNAISRVMERIGGYWYLDYGKDLHAFLTADAAAQPITDHDAATMIDITQSVDLSQIATRVTARGGGARLAVELGPGATIIPLEKDDVSWYADSGGYVEMGPQPIGYSRVEPGGTGSAVSGKPTGAPASAPVAAAVVTAGTLVGSYSYRIAFVTSGAESPSSPSSNAIQVPAGLPANTMIPYMQSGGRIPAGTFTRFRASAIVSGVELLLMESAGDTMPPYTFTWVNGSNFPNGGTWYVDGMPLGPAGTTERRVYRSDNGAAYRLCFASTDLVMTSFGTAVPYGELGAVMPSMGTNQPPGRATLTNILVGPVGTTARRIYRTGGYDADYRLVATLNDNTTTVYSDNVADSARGAAATAEGTVGVAVGDPAIQVANLAAFPEAGWVAVGNQRVQYFSRSGPSGIGSLRDIPATGPGAITAPISVGTEVVVLPQLICATAIYLSVPAGENVNVLTKAEDVTAQQAMADWVGSGDGVHEMVISDGRWSETEALARASTELARRKDPRVRITFDSRDRTLQSGRDVSISLTSPAIVGTFTIQRVTTTQLGLAHAWPLRSVELSSVRVSFEDLLRQIRGPQ